MFHGINDRAAADIHIRQRPVFRSFRIKPGSLPTDRFDHLIRYRSACEVAAFRREDVLSLQRGFAA